MKEANSYKGYIRLSVERIYKSIGRKNEANSYKGFS